MQTSVEIFKSKKLNEEYCSWLNYEDRVKLLKKQAHDTYLYDYKAITQDLHNSMAAEAQNQLNQTAFALQSDNPLNIKPEFLPEIAKYQSEVQHIRATLTDDMRCPSL